MRNAAVVLSSLVALGIPAASGSALEWHRIVAIGESTPVGVVDDVDTVRVLADGTVYFAARIGTTRPLLRWTKTGGLTVAFAAESRPAAGSAPPIAVESFGDEFEGLDYDVHEDGTLCVAATARADACPDLPRRHGIVLCAPPGGAFETVLQIGTPIPVLGGAWTLDDAVGGIRLPLMNAAGEIAFRGMAVEENDVCADESSPATLTGVFGPDGSGGFAPIATVGQAAPGIEDATIEGLRASFLDNAGTVVVSVDLPLPAVPRIQPMAVYRWTAGTGLELVAGYGTAVEVLTLGQPLPKRLRDDGSILIVDRDPMSAGIYEWDATNGLRALHRIGDEAPDADGRLFAGFHDIDVVATDAGTLAFRATLVATGAGIWTQRGTEPLALRALTGGALPDTPGAILHLRLVAANDAGRVLYSGLTDAVIESTQLHEWALVSSDPGAPPRRVLAPGFTLDFGGGPEPVAGEHVYTDPDVRHAVLLTADAELNRTGLFAADLPEPDVGAAAAIALLTLACRRRCVAASRRASRAALPTPRARRARALRARRGFTSSSGDWPIFRRCTLSDSHSRCSQCCCRPWPPPLHTTSAPARR